MGIPFTRPFSPPLQMASRKPRKPAVDYSAIWRDVLPRVLNASLLVCVLCNFIALGYGIMKNNPKEVHHIDSVVTNHFFVVTQVVSSVSAPSNVSSSSVSESSQLREVPASYHYMKVNGRPMFRYFGQNYGVGDLTSYGRVLSVFPDRVTIEGPLVLRNDRNPDGDSLSFLKPPNVGNLKHD